MKKKHAILGGKVHVYKRANSNCWQCAAHFKGQSYRTSTKEDSLATAKEFAEDWYLTLRGKTRAGEILQEKTFADAAEKFKIEYEVLTMGERHPRYVKNHYQRLNMHLLPYFGKMGLSKINGGVVQEYRVFRSTGGPESRPPTRSTLHHETVTLRQVLKTAVRHGWLDYVPDLSPPFRASSKITHRAWFSPEDYKRLYEASRINAEKASGTNWHWAAEQLHDYILFMANTGLRPDEANRLEYRDVEIVEDEDSDEEILVIEVRGKRGVGYCKSTANAVWPFKRLLERNAPEPEALVFPVDHKRQFNRLLNELKLKLDRDGNRRTAYSLRHTYICLRLMEGADIYQIAKNCRTSVEMIEKYYASHIKNTLNAAAINVRR